MLTRRTAGQTIAWFLDLHHGKQLDLNPDYQRRSVWNEDYREYFMDTVLRNYPSPAVFLDVEITSTARTVYHVVDGKQRLTAIIDFVLDRYQTKESYSGPDVGNRYYSQLPEERKAAFLRYVVPVEFLEGAELVELQQAFDRLNRNVAKLNAQELRNARFSGAFISLMESLADDPFWTDVGIATKARVRRMLDIEYVSEIFVLTMRGIQDGKDVLDDVYAECDSEIPDLDAHRRKYETCKGVIGGIWPHLTTARFRNLADFYSLWAATLNILANDGRVNHEQTAEHLSSFANLVNDGAEAPDVQRYLVAATQGSNKAPNRDLRAGMLQTLFVLEG